MIKVLHLKLVIILDYENVRMFCKDPKTFLKRFMNNNCKKQITRCLDLKKYYKRCKVKCLMES